MNGSRILSCWWSVGRFVLTALGVLLLSYVVVRLHAGSQNSLAARIDDFWVRILYASWVVLVPVYFMVEYVWGIKWCRRFDQEFKDELDYWKGTQERAKNIWLAASVAIGIVLFGKT